MEKEEEQTKHPKKLSFSPGTKTTPKIILTLSQPLVEQDLLKGKSSL